MTNFDDDDIDLGLALGCSTLNVQTKTKDDLGAGVNASSMVDMAFAASDPLSELVWSPHKGLSLKCAESGLADKKPFRLWNVGPSTLIAAPSQSDRFKGTYDENAVYEKIIDSQEKFQATNEMVLKSGNEIGCSSKVVIMNPADGVDRVDANQDEENVRNTEKGYCVTRDIAQTVESCENHADQGDFGTERFLLHGASSKVDMETIECLAGRINKEISTSDKSRKGDVSSGSPALIPTVKDSEACLLTNSPIEMEADNTLESSNLPALDKLECTAENDVHLPGTNETCDQNEEQHLKDSSFPLETSPTHSRSSSYRRKGKGKALSDGNVNSKMSNDEEDSHESVESCNSTGLVPKGKKRWHFEQQFSVGSKRIRTDLHGNPARESTVAHNSSFMTWISNMVKGLSKSNLEESPTLDLTSTPNNEENHGKETNRQEIVMYEKDHDSSSRSMGFQSVFQSLYCPTSKVPETEIPKEGHSMGESNKLPSADKILIDVPPISCHPGDDMLDAHMPMSNDKFNQSTVACKEVPLVQTQIMPAVVASSDIGCSKAKDGLCPSDSMSRLRTSICEDKNTSHSSEYDMSNRSQSLRSLWITRFSNKTPGAVLNIDDNSKPTTHEIITCSTECRRPNPQAQTSVECRIEQASSDAKETSASSKEIHDNNYERSMNNLHPIISSAKFKKSEALASLFARRLDALKLTVPSSTRSECSYTRTTCFFCGRSGHDLRNCSEVTESELEVLIRSIGSYDGAEESSCLCIRCFQLDHWAISCPTSSSNRSQQLEHNISLVNQNRNDNLRLFSDNECSPSLLEIKQGHPIELANRVHHSRDKSSSDLMHNRKKFWFAITSGSNQVQKQITSDPTENSLKENINLVTKEIADVPKGIFDVIRGLRLSRVDILKWMNSNTSLSHLDGFFLRLRLGKCEAGLGGTGYYVACITGLNGEKLERDSNNCIYVDVCGVKCFVGSQYVSNQDFLEDELTTWWRKTLESGGNVPTREDLRLKLDERMKLGF